MKNQAIIERKKLSDQIDVLTERIDILEASYRTAEERVELKSLVAARLVLLTPYNRLNQQLVQGHNKANHDSYLMKHYENWMH